MKTNLPAWLAACCVALSAATAQAGMLKLEPSDTRIGLTVYAMGMFPQAGHFTQFSGSLSVDPAHPGSCRVAILVQVASLAMATQTSTRMALGPSMLDAGHYPTFEYEGDCTPTSTSGQLTLHGVTHALQLAAARDGKGITARGVLHRQDYGMRGLPGLIGGTIHIDFAVDLPPDLAPDLAKELPR